MQRYKNILRYANFETRKVNFLLFLIQDTISGNRRRWVPCGKHIPIACTPALSTSRAGRHLPRPYGERDIGSAYDAGMSDARRRTEVRARRGKARGRGQRRGKPPTPRAITKRQIIFACKRRKGRTGCPIKSGVMNINIKRDNIPQ